MNIVFDIDDTIVDETGFMLKWAPLYLKLKCKFKPVIRNQEGYNLSEVFGLEEVFQKDFAPKGDLDKVCKIESGFWTSFFVLYILHPVKRDARKMINELKANGNNIYIVSCRGRRAREKETIYKETIRIRIVSFLTKKIIILILRYYWRIWLLS